MSLIEKTSEFILSNLVVSSKRKIGIEVESIFYNKDMKRLPVNNGEKFSSIDFLEEMKDVKRLKGVSGEYSLEPGGQLEWSSPPVRNLVLINDLFKTHKYWTKEICKKNNLFLIDFATEPIYSPEEIDLINMKKYSLMHKHFLDTGKHGPWMMRNTASVQINLDVTSKQDAQEMAFIADCLQPFSSILFSNSPFHKGQPAGKNNIRYKIWNDTDAKRCNHLLDHDINSSIGLIKKYSKYILQVPALFIKDSNNNIQHYEGTLGDRLSEIKKINDQDIQDALHQIFTHVRFKHILEIRGCDCPPEGDEMAPVAFWVGILCAEKNRSLILEMVEEWTEKERRELNNSVESLNLNKKGPKGRRIIEWMEIVCNFALSGLQERQEQQFLSSFINNFFRKGPKSLQTQNEFKHSGLNILDFIKRRCSKNQNN